MCSYKKKMKDDIMKEMNSKTLKNIIYSFFVILLVGIMNIPATVRAENGQALSISPPVLELNADPGQTVKASIKLTNISSGDLLIKNQVNDFGAKNESGEPNILFDESEATAFSLKNWVTAPAPFKIASRETKTVDFIINVPQGAEPGGHYAVMRFTGQAPELEETGVALSASLGSLVLLKISGEAKEQATVADFFSAKPDYSKSSFFEYPPINFVERIRNDGNIHINPTGTVEIKDMFGRTVDTIRVNGDPASLKDKPRAILPNSTRRFEQALSKPWMFGRYTANMSLTYGEPTNLKILSSATEFWVIPYKLIAFIILIIILLVLVIRFINKRYKQRIIKKYAGNTQPPSHTDKGTKNTNSELPTTHPGKKPTPPQKLDLRSTNKPEKPGPHTKK